MSTIPINGSTTGATYDTTTKQINTIPPPNPNNNGTIINTNSAPIVDNSGLHSDIKTQTAAIQAQIAQIQAQVDAAQKAGYSNNQQIQKDARGNIIPATSTPLAEQSNWDKILGIFNAGKAQIAALPALPTVEDTTNKILATFGYTPDSFKQVASMNAQLASTTDQLNQMEQQKNQQLADVANRTGGTIDLMNAESTRINRNASVAEAGLSAKGTLLQAQISTLTGNYEKATTMAQNYVQLATTAQRQVVSDIEYSMDFYKDVYSAMDKSTQDAAQQALDNAYRAQVLAETKAQNAFDNAIKSSQLKIDQANAGRGTTTSDKILSPTELKSINDQQGSKFTYGTTQNDVINYNSNQQEIQSLKDSGNTKDQTETAIKKFLGTATIPSEIQSIINSIYPTSQKNILQKGWDWFANAVTLPSLK
jgi:hypothetical protein